MLAARLTQVPLTAFVTGIGRQAISIKPVLVKPCNFTTRAQSYATKAARFGRRKMAQSEAKSQTLKERLMAPAGDGGRHYRKVPKFSVTRKLCCNLPKIQTKRQNLMVFC